MRPIALPADRAEVDLEIQGAAGELVEWTRGVKLEIASRRLVPILRSQRLDARGRGTLTLLSVLSSDPEDFAPGSSATLLRGTLPTGITLGTVVEARRSRTGVFARELAYAIGPAVQAAERSRASAEYVAFGAVLATTMRTLDRLRAERFPDTATELLGEWERRYRAVVSPSLSLTDRRAIVLARVRGAFGGPESRVLAAIRSVDPAAEIVNGRSALVQDTPEQVYRFAVTLDAAVFEDTSKRDAIRATVRQMAPAHAVFDVGVHIAGFRCDDSNSLCDVDFLGG